MRQWANILWIVWDCFCGDEQPWGGSREPPQGDLMGPDLGKGAGL